MRTTGNGHAAATSSAARIAVVERLDDRTLFATFIVDTALDGGMMGTFRRAIQDANSTPGADTIVFDIAPGGPQTIDPFSPLPPIHDPVTIDATTQPGFAGDPIIELTGGGTGPAFGLHLIGGSDGSVIRGFVINNWSRSGIAIQAGSANNVIAGNWIGLDLTGNVQRPNVNGGIDVDGAGPNNRIGGTVAPDRNVISGNQNPGIHVRFTDNTFIQGNYIGTNATGTAAVPNSGGIFLEEANFTLIGGSTQGRNVISGNIGDGILLFGASENIIDANYIGSTADGTGAINNAGAGVDVHQNSSLNRIGVSGGVGNVIVHNNAGGIIIEWQDNFVQNNRIGVDAGGNAAGNFNNGITITDFRNTIGGPDPGDGNVIANSGGAGVAVLDGHGNLIRNNSIFNNGGLGIDLSANPSVADGPTSNDPLDPDEGANDLQNFPVITSATTSGGITTIQGTINSTANTTFVIELFSSVLPDPTGFGEGQTLVATVTVTTDAFGNASFTATTATAVPGGRVVTATATNVVRGSTSEFSAATAVVEIPPPPPPDPGNGNGNHNGNGNGNGNHNGATGTNNGKHNGHNK